MLLRGTPLELSQKEFALLRVLAAEPTRVWTKEELLRTVWGYRAWARRRTHRLPRLPSAAQARRRTATSYVVNVWGIGYRLLDPVAPSVLEAA